MASSAESPSSAIFSKDIDNYKETFKSDTEILLIKSFPEKIDHLINLIQSETFDLSDESLSRDTFQEYTLNIPIPEPAKDGSELLVKPLQNLTIGEVKRKDDDSKGTVVLFPNGLVSSSEYIVGMVNIVRPMICQLVKDANTFRIGIMLMVPQIEDGDNFGVQIQEEVLYEAEQIQSECEKKLDRITTYFSQRAKLITKIAKYPYCGDFRRAVFEYDQRFRFILCMVIRELRNHYIHLHDLFVKNMGKIKKPKSSNKTEMMY